MQPTRGELETPSDIRRCLCFKARLGARVGALVRVSLVGAVEVHVRKIQAVAAMMVGQCLSPSRLSSDDASFSGAYGLLLCNSAQYILQMLNQDISMPLACLSWRMERFLAKDDARAGETVLSSDS